MIVESHHYPLLDIHSLKKNNKGTVTPRILLQQKPGTLHGEIAGKIASSFYFVSNSIPVKDIMDELDSLEQILALGVVDDDGQAYLYFGGIVTGALGIVLVVLGGVFLLTSVVAFCPLYAPFKFSTYKG